MIESFPNLTPRPAQVKALDFIRRAILGGYHDIVIEMPTGGGKTLVATTACRWAATQHGQAVAGNPGGYILVHQKLLQDQIAAELDRLSTSDMPAKLVKSATEYICHKSPKKTCALSRNCSAKKHGDCTYKQAKSEFMAAPVAVTNYAYFLAEREFVGDLGNRQVTVLDEAHGVARLVTDHVGLSVSYEAVEPWSPELANALADVKSEEEFVGYLRVYYPQAKSRADELEAMAAGGELGQDFEREVAEARRHELKVARVLASAGAGGLRNWVFWSAPDRNNQPICYLKPLSAADYFDQLFPPGGVRLFMSAYPGSRPTFCRELGLDPAKVAWLRLKSDFDAKKRPVHLLNVASLAKRQLEATLPSVVRMAVKIAQRHAAERGVIHTHSYVLTQAILDGLRGAGLGDRVIAPAKAEEREAAVARHAESSNTILVSPSLFEGFDFRGDLARWQILTKCPFPSLGDAQVRAKAELDPLWYKIEAFKSLLQAAGRGMRSADDWCVTYALDKDISRLMADVRDHVPQWFLEAVHEH